MRSQAEIVQLHDIVEDGEAEQAKPNEIVVDVEAAQAKADKVVAVVAEQAANENARPEHSIAAEVNSVASDEAAEEVVETNTCELCDRTFETLKGLRAHIGKRHKAIPQVDGSNDVTNEATYCKVCKECPDEIELGKTSIIT